MHNAIVFGLFNSFQLWLLSKAGEIRRDDWCMDYSGESVVILPCHGQKGNQEWEYSSVSIEEEMFCIVKSTVLHTDDTHSSYLVLLSHLKVTCQDTKSLAISLLFHYHFSSRIALQYSQFICLCKLLIIQSPSTLSDGSLCLLLPAFL